MICSQFYSLETEWQNVRLHIKAQGYDSVQINICSGSRNQN